ncbi:putative calcium-binding protein CML41 [Acorus gramineus]|uniref:Calcium-binding protein CML41 n=1 Tax=Acorus gramineus TaxID=55184 RepID=A0AAV9AVP3_ACOGR|nr:putative calcium-binding protein CML41 [Acorus gramineus]
MAAKLVVSNKPPKISKTSLPTESRTQELLEVFSRFDVNRDGKITAEELKLFFASMGEEMKTEEAELAIAELDSDGDGVLDFKEFVVLMETTTTTDLKEDLRTAFGMFEAEKGSGRITAGGLRRMLGRLGEESSYEECEVMIRAYDVDGDGELDFYEFQMMMT